MSARFFLLKMLFFLLRSGQKCGTKNKNKIEEIDMEKNFPLNLLFSDGTVSDKLEDGKKVIGIKVTDKSVIGLRNYPVKDSLDGVERRCNRDAKINKEGVVMAPPSSKQVEGWMEKRKEINETIEMLQEQGVPADKLEGVIMTATRSGFSNYTFNMASGEKSLINSSSNGATLRPSVSIDKEEIVPARNYDETAYGKSPAWRKNMGYNSGYEG